MLAALAFSLLAVLTVLVGCGDDSPSPTALRLAAAKTSGDTSRGLALVAQYQCGACHAIPGVPASRGIHGPSLEAFGKRSYIAGRVPNTPASLAHWIAQPSALVPDTAMPSMGVSPEEARHMAAYLGSLE